MKSYTQQLEEHIEQLQQSLAKTQAHSLQWYKVSPRLYEFRVGAYAIGKVEKYNDHWVAMIIAKGFNNGSGGFCVHQTPEAAKMDVEETIFSTIP
jgi:hypothetical protein